MIKKDLLKKGLAIAAFVAFSFSIPVLAGCNAITGNGQAGIVAEADSSGSSEKTDHDDKADYDEAECTVITLNGTSASAEGSGVTTADGTVTITEEGSYNLRGSFDGIIIVETDKEAKVQIILDGATVKNAGSAGIYVKSADKVYLTLADGSTNEIANSGEFVAIDDEDVNAAIYSKEDLVINGNGSLTVTSEKGHAVKSNDDLKVTGGALTVDAAKDGLHAKEELTIDGGTITINASEGIEATIVTINDGNVTIDATDDGINASLKSEDVGTPTVEINGGYVTITMAKGDTDGIDTNGNLYINGGTVNITAQFPFDYDGEAKHNGGTIIVNGEEIDEITNQFGGQGGGFGGPGGFERGNRGGEDTPEGFEPGDAPEDFDPSNMPEGFGNGERPERPDGGNRPDGGKGGGKQQKNSSEDDGTI